MQSKCELEVVMLSDNMVAQSATLIFSRVDSRLFLDWLYPELVASLHKALPKISSSKVHNFNIAQNEMGVNLTFAVSYDFEKDVSPR